MSYRDMFANCRSLHQFIREDVKEKWSIKQNENFDVKGPFEALLGHFNVLLLHAPLSELDNGALFSSSGTSKF